MRVLGIESSCDETAVAIYDSSKGVIAHAMHTQIPMHQEYGGVVPELASRDHTRYIVSLVRQAMREAGCEPSDIDGIAYTAGPGLIGALLVGSCFARSLAYAWGKPCIGVNHLEGHLLAAMLEESAPEYPFVSLLVSGGHSMLIAVKGLGEYELLGETLDDAAGEAFDKTAKMLGLAYPGGPKIAKLAEQGRPGVYNFPRPMVNRPGMDLSFSGLKTHTLQTWLSSSQSEQDRADIALAFQDAIVDTLVIKSKRALIQTGLRQLVIAGGVGANAHLRERLQEMTTELGTQVFYPRLEYCTDNGAMIAYAGYQRLKSGQRDGLRAQARARWPLS